MTACNGTPPHVRDCFGAVESPGPGCGEPVPQWVLARWPGQLCGAEV